MRTVKKEIRELAERTSVSAHCETGSSRSSLDGVGSEGDRPTEKVKEVMVPEAWLWVHTSGLECFVKMCIGFFLCATFVW